jgi:hypothetical protein
MKNTNKNKKTVAAKTAKNTKAQTIEVAPVVPAIQKRGRGRPFGSVGMSVVNLQDLVNALPQSATLPLSNAVLRSLTKIGVNIPSTPFRAANGAITEITKKYVKPAANVVIQDLNAEA